MKGASNAGIGGGQPLGAPVVINVIPTTGQTVGFNNSVLDQLMVVSPAGALANLTINFPSDASSRLTQIVRVAFNKSITTAAWGGAANIFNAPTTFNANDTVAFQKTAADTWMKS